MIVTTDAISVLVPVHASTAPEHLQASLRSIGEQTLPAREVVLVQDGPLSAAQDAVVTAARDEMPQLVVLTPGRVGLAAALQVGLTRCTLDWVARMDADDIAEPRRLAVQAEAAASGRYDVIGSAMLEFADDPDRPNAVRRLPQSHEAILRRMRFTNPLNHPTVLLRRTAALEAGGYAALAGLEDYDLWARMAAQGARFHNLADPLVRYRVDDGIYARRRGRALLHAELEMQRNLVRYGMVGRPRAAVNAFLRIGFRLLPPRLMKVAYAATRR